MEVQEDGSTQVSLGERPVVMTTIDEKDCSPVPLDERKY